jgi:hypothetical protein
MTRRQTYERTQARVIRAIEDLESDKVIYTFAFGTSRDTGPIDTTMEIRGEPGEYQMGVAYTFEITIRGPWADRSPRIDNSRGVQIGNGNVQTNSW